MGKRESFIDRVRKWRKGWVYVQLASLLWYTMRIALNRMTDAIHVLHPH
jgi:hypothetical protein